MATFCNICLLAECLYWSQRDNYLINFPPAWCTSEYPPVLPADGAPLLPPGTRVVRPDARV